MLLRTAEIDWEDTAVSIKNTTEWLAKKGEFEKEALGEGNSTTFVYFLGSLPILRLNGQTFYQTGQLFSRGFYMNDKRFPSERVWEFYEENGERFPDSIHDEF